MPERRITMTLLLHKHISLPQVVVSPFTRPNKHISCRTMWLSSHLHNSFDPKPHFAHCTRHNTFNMTSRTTKVFNKGEEIILPLQWFTLYNWADLCCDVAAAAAAVPLLYSYSWLRHYWNALNWQQECGVGNAPPYYMFHCPLFTNYKLLMHFPFQETWTSICISQK
jgi:hypothetical protein